MSICIPDAFSISGSVSVFLSLERGRWRKGNIYGEWEIFMSMVLYLLSFFESLLLFVLFFFQAAQFLYSIAGGKVTPQQ